MRGHYLECDALRWALGTRTALKLEGFEGEGWKDGRVCDLEGALAGHIGLLGVSWPALAFVAYAPASQRTL